MTQQAPHPAGRPMTAPLVRSSRLVPARPGHTPGVVVPVLYRDDHRTTHPAVGQLVPEVFR